jgi:D-glycero-D-manno-heptose 1,7-bisphosphate phosphatase
MDFAPGIAEAVSRLGQLDARLVVVSSPSGEGPGRFADSALCKIEARLASRFTECGATLSGYFRCRHGARRAQRLACICRKPMPGRLHLAAAELGLQLSSSWMIGDTLDDADRGRLPDGAGA